MQHQSVLHVDIMEKAFNVGVVQNGTGRFRWLVLACLWHDLVVCNGNVPQIGYRVLYRLYRGASNVVNCYNGVQWCGSMRRYVPIGAVWWGYVVAVPIVVLSIPVCIVVSFADYPPF